jgi:hypothetical protein
VTHCVNKYNICRQENFPGAARPRQAIADSLPGAATSQAGFSGQRGRIAMMRLAPDFFMERLG